MSNLYPGEALIFSQWPHSLFATHHLYTFPALVEKQKLARTPFDIARYQSLDFDILTEVVPFFVDFSKWNDDGPTEVNDAVGHRRFDA